VIAARVPEPIEKGLPGTGLLAHVVTGELADHLPLYRQGAAFRRHGVELARSTMCDWMAASAGLLEPIVKAMARRVLSSKVIGADDTPVTVQDHAGKGSKAGRLWAYLGDRDNRFVVYDYTPTWGAEGPERFLKAYPSGHLQSDGYAGYDRLHARGLVAVGRRARGGSSTRRGPVTRSGRTRRSPGSAISTASSARRGRGAGTTPG
jgi:hypothetical protein